MKRRLSFEDEQRMGDLRIEADRCMGKAHDAASSDRPVVAREWFDAADAALRIIRTIEAPWPEVPTP